MASYDHRDVGPSDARHPEPTPATPAREAVPRAPTRLPTSTNTAQLDLEGVTIDRTGEIPIGVQLAWALRARIGDGRLAPGRRLPGLRELAETLGINANTVRAVYQRLEQEGLIDSRQGTGTFVASIAPEPSAVGQIAADAARQARRTGVDPRQVAAALYVTPEPPAGDAERDATLAGERRRELRAQIAALEQTLSEIQARHPGLIPAPLKPLRNAGPRLLSVEELERVRAQLVRRLAEAEPLLEGPAKSVRAPARERQRVARGTRATTQAKQSTKTEPPAADGPPVADEAPAAKKSARPRTRPRPSTA